MTSVTTNSTANTLAKIISILFHPLLIPLYGVLIIISAPTIFGFLPVEIKKILLTIILINNFLLPLFLLPYFRYRNIISSWTIIKREERILPLIVTTFFYFVTGYIFLRFNIPVFIKAFVFTAAILSLCLTIINAWFKISLHSAGAGALLALILVLSICMQTPLTWYLIISVIVAGALLSSRLWLESHTPSEVWSGFFLGLITTALILLISSHIP